MRTALFAAFILGAQIGAVGATDRYSRRYDPVLDATTESLTVRVEPPQIALQIAIVYVGHRRTAIPNRIEMLVTSSGSPIGDAPKLESSIDIQVDGKRFTCGTRNARDVATTNAVALVCDFDDFRVFADARTVAGRAYGIAFTITLDGLVALHDLADRWATPE